MRTDCKEIVEGYNTREVITVYSYTLYLKPQHNGIIIVDGKERKIDRPSVLFQATQPLTYKEVVDKFKGTEGILTIRGEFKA